MFELLHVMIGINRRIIYRFLSNFAKRTFTVNDQVKIINDFLNVSMIPLLELCLATHTLF